MKKTIPQHKRMAMGGEGNIRLGYAKGGSVGTGKVSAAKDPLVAARRNNGVKGMKDGGKC